MKIGSNACIIKRRIKTLIWSTCWSVEVADFLKSHHLRKRVFIQCWRAIHNNLVSGTTSMRCSRWQLVPGLLLHHHTLATTHALGALFFFILGTSTPHKISTGCLERPATIKLAEGGTLTYNQKTHYTFPNSSSAPQNISICKATSTHGKSTMSLT